MKINAGAFEYDRSGGPHEFMGLDAVDLRTDLGFTGVGVTAGVLTI